jgi:hypothetical protein
MTTLETLIQLKKDLGNNVLGNKTTFLGIDQVINQYIQQAQEEEKASKSKK